MLKIFFLIVEIQLKVQYLDLCCSFIIYRYSLERIHRNFEDLEYKVYKDLEKLKL